MTMSIKPSVFLHRSASLKLLLCWLYALCLLCFSSSLMAQPSCEPSDLYSKLNSYQQQVDSGSVVKVQQQLRALGYLIREDDIAGLETAQALYQFCRAINYSQHDESLEPLLQQLQRYVVISLSYPDWQQTVSSPEFAAWLAMQPSKVALDSLWDAGGAPLVMKLLAEYQAQRNLFQEEPSHYYMLTAKLAGDFPDFLKPMVDMPFSNQHLFEQAANKLHDLAQEADKSTELDISKLTEQSLQSQAGKALRAINLSGGDCGCRQRFKEGSEVIGFYPYWMSLEQTPAEVNGEDAADATSAVPEPDIVDFSNLSRIAYYAMSLDGEGLLNEPRHWQEDALVRGLFEQAHKYMSRVDLLVYSNLWYFWDDEAIDKVVAELLDKVLLKMERNYGQSSLFESAQSDSPQDGIILYFAGYTQQAQSRENIVQLLERLRKAMMTAQLQQHVSIMLDIDLEASKVDDEVLGELGKALLSVINAEGVISVQEKNELTVGQLPMVNHLLLYLEEPTTQSKKDLHSILSNEFRGRARSTMLKKTIPIISPINQSSEPRSEDKPYIQFIDDLIYAQNNFGGVGLWPLVTANQEDVDQVNSLISNEFATLKEDQLQALVESQLPGLCTFLCPNRSLLWQGLLALAMLILTYGLAALWYCKVRLFYKDHQLYFMGTALAMLCTALALMVCNPMMPWSSDAIAIGLLLLMMGYWVWGYVLQIQKDKLP